jgi:hypothetical protein
MSCLQYEQYLEVTMQNLEKCHLAQIDEKEV